MSLERLDMTCKLELGTRDACHVPFIVGQLHRNPVNYHFQELKPGEFVKFVDEKFQKFVTCGKDEAHGILNPFIDEISMYESVVVFILPGITTSVRHTFNIDPKLKEYQKELLEEHLKASKEDDPNCAGCYEIRNNTIIRN
jgi:hypothetical protein